MPGTETHTRGTAIESMLERHLGPVPAPGELSDLIHGDIIQGNRVRSMPRRFGPRLAWALTAALLVLAAATAIRARLSAVPDEAVAFQALARDAGSLEFLSAKAPEIRAWVRNQTGVEVPLETNADVKLIGARVAESGSVEIDYRVGERRAALIVSREPVSRESAKHWMLAAKPYREMNSLAWSMAGQHYIVACAGDLQVACLICHADGRTNPQSQTAVN